MKIQKEYFTKKNLSRLKKSDVISVAKYLKLDNISWSDRKEDIINDIIEFVNLPEEEARFVEEQDVPTSVRIRRIKESTK